MWWPPPKKLFQYYIFQVEQHCFEMFRSDKRVWKYIFTFDRNKHLLLMEIHIYFWHLLFYGSTYILLIDINIYFWWQYIYVYIYFWHLLFYGSTYILTVMEIHVDCDWNTFGLLVEIHIYFGWNTSLLLLEIHIYFCWKYIFTFDGNTYLLLVHLEGLHLLLLSSGPVDCSDQKGIDDPFSGLIDIERHLFRFHIVSRQWWWS